MSPDQFTARKSGELVVTQFAQSVRKDGKIETRMVKGLAFVPNDLPPKLSRSEIIEAVLDDLIAAEKSLSHLDGIAEDLPSVRLLWAPLARREAILSSKIEDTVATAVELASAEAGEKPKRQEVTEVMAYVHALDHGLVSKLPICLRLLREMHSKLFEAGAHGTDKQPGEFRDIQNYIGNEEIGFTGARFVPPPPGQQLIEGLSALELYANQKNYNVPKLVAIAMMHYQFEALHPFKDGNGRIGRLLSALSLCRMGLIKQPFVYLSGFFEPRRNAYNDLMLRVSTHGDWLGWIKFFVEAVAHQTRDAEERVRGLRSLRERLRSNLVNDNGPAKIYGLIDSLFEHPVISADQVAKKLAVSKPTARSYLDRLVEMGALVLMDKPYRQLWVSKPIINIIDANNSNLGADSEAG